VVEAGGQGEVESQLVHDRQQVVVGVGEAALPRDAHSFLHVNHAGPDVWDIVDGHHAGRTTPDGAEETPRAVVLHAATKYPQSVCVECSRNCFFSVSLDWFAFEMEYDSTFAVERKHRVLRYPVALQVDIPFSVLESSPAYCQKVFSNIQVIILDIDGFLWAGADALPAKVAVWYMVPNS
jgi:hypothetical protein